MIFFELLFDAKNFIDKPSIDKNWYKDIRVIDFGSRWMFDRLTEISPNEVRYYNESINFLAYGIFKYAFSIFITTLSSYIILQVDWRFFPLFIFIFYFIEVHFLFLFPILFDNIRRPIFTSMKCTYKLGLITAISNVIPIGIFMLCGLMNFKNPLRNWLVGCIAILIWYRDEIRDRI
ncbi:hypothetical protein P3G55_14220 [Leptospira sp. 96542]|nr:hypothetical protein [Leptospira sp. 96542]